MFTQTPEQMFGPLPVSGPERPPAEIKNTFDDRLSHILHSATEVIARVGYQKATMRAVAKASGVSLAGLYHYFDSKEKMLFLIQFRTFSSLLNNLREKINGIDNPRQQLQIMIRAHIAYFAANMAALKVCSHELDSLTGEAYQETRRIRREYYELTRKMIDRIFQQTPTAYSADHHVATMCLFGMLNWLYRWYNPKRDRSHNSLADQITTQFLSGLLSNPVKPTGSQRMASPSNRGNGNKTSGG